MYICIKLFRFNPKFSFINGDVRDLNLLKKIVPHFDIYPILQDADGTTFTSYDQEFWSELTADGSVVDDTGTRYNYAAVAQLMNPSKRQSTGAIGEFEIEFTRSLRKWSID